MHKPIALLGLLSLLLFAAPAATALPQPIDPSSWPVAARTDPRFASFNIEMAEVTGSEFWAPYDDPAKRRYAPRAPVDLSSPRLQALARAIGPAMIRVSGTWANATYVAAPGERIVMPPPGYRQVLTAERWREMVAFANKARMPLLLSFAASDGTRDRNGR